MDDKGRQIAFQVAWKAAVELIAAGKASLESSDPGEEIAAFAATLYGPLARELEGLEATAPAPVAPITPAPSAQAAAPSTVPTTDLAPCPECQEANPPRNGILIQNTDPTFRGPEFTCSLVERKKQGGKWVDVGPCTYQDWGRNSRF